MSKAYTTEQVKIMETLYKKDDSDADRKVAVTELATRLSKTRQSVISKLSRMGVYVTPQRTTKAGTPVVNKDAYIQHIRIMLGASEAQDISSLEKVTKSDLKIMSDLLNRLSDRQEVK